MVAVFVLTAAAALAAIYVEDANITALMSVPFGLLTINLSAAIVARPRFRADVPLLLFHVALLAMVILFGAARMTYLDGTTTLSSGMDFDGELLRDDRGAWHPDRLSTLRFANEGFTENFPERGRYLSTYSRIRWWDEHDESHVAEIGDDRPLVLNGYRIYTSRFRGFSPVFLWESVSGDMDLGILQLNDTRSGQFAPANEWEIPGGPAAWAMLELRSDDDPAPGTRRQELGVGELDHVLVVRIDDQRYELEPGNAIELDAGRLTYVRLDSWMGYRIAYDPTRPWLIATVIVAIGCLLWFYARPLRSRVGVSVEERR